MKITYSFHKFAKQFGLEKNGQSEKLIWLLNSLARFFTDVIEKKGILIYDLKNPDLDSGHEIVNFPILFPATCRKSKANIKLICYRINVFPVEASYSPYHDELLKIYKLIFIGSDPASVFKFYHYFRDFLEEEFKEPLISIVNLEMNKVKEDAGQKVVDTLTEKKVHWVCLKEMFELNRVGRNFRVLLPIFHVISLQFITQELHQSLPYELRILPNEIPLTISSGLRGINIKLDLKPIEEGMSGWHNVTYGSFVSIVTFMAGSEGDNGIAAKLKEDFIHFIEKRSVAQLIKSGWEELMSRELSSLNNPQIFKFYRDYWANN